MPDQFKPLIPPSATPASVGHPEPFKVMPATQGPKSENPSTLDPRPSTLDPAAQPVITLERDGDQVKLIRVQCSCGQVIELACAY